MPALTALLVSASETIATSATRSLPARGVTSNDSEPAAAEAVRYWPVVASVT